MARGGRAAEGVLDGCEAPPQRERSAAAPAKLRAKKRRCIQCGGEGGSLYDAKDGYGLVCHECRRKVEDGEFCPVCEGLWFDHDDGMIECDGDGCGKWVHCECEQLDPKLANIWNGQAYKCPDCRGHPAGEGLTLPAREERDCASCGAARPAETGGTRGDKEAALCDACMKRWDEKEYCAVCEELWDPTSTEMVECDGCELWVTSLATASSAKPSSVSLTTAPPTSARAVDRPSHRRRRRRTTARRRMLTRRRRRRRRRHRRRRRVLSSRGCRGCAPPAARVLPPTAPSAPPPPLPRHPAAG